MASSSRSACVGTCHVADGGEKFSPTLGKEVGEKMLATKYQKHMFFLTNACILTVCRSDFSRILPAERTS